MISIDSSFSERSSNVPDGSFEPVLSELLKKSIVSPNKEDAHH